MSAPGDSMHLRTAGLAKLLENIQFPMNLQAKGIAVTCSCDASDYSIKAFISVSRVKGRVTQHRAAQYHVDHHMVFRNQITASHFVELHMAKIDCEKFLLALDGNQWVRCLQQLVETKASLG